MLFTDATGRAARGGHLATALRQIAVWIDRRRQRHALAELNDRMLRDINVSREAARREAGRPFWDY
jgi:uncharacterized protein YjiS (DUF1127 family)